MVVKWRFDDPQTSASYTFDINPSKGGTPKYTRSIDTSRAVAPDGQAIITEGRRSLSTSSFDGTILDQISYDAIKEWFNKPYPIIMTDDLSRMFEIVITAFSPSRERSVTYPWKHSYTVDYIILSEI